MYGVAKSMSKVAAYMAPEASLGHKPFRKYKEWKPGPQSVVLSILKEIDELGPELEKIYNKEKI